MDELGVPFCFLHDFLGISRFNSSFVGDSYCFKNLTLGQIVVSVDIHNISIYLCI